MVGGPEKTQPWCHDHDSARRPSRATARSRGAARDPRRGQAARADPPDRRARPQDRRCGRRAGAPPRHRPHHPAGRLRGARLLRRCRAHRLRRVLAVDPGGRQPPPAARPRRPQPRHRAGRRRAPGRDHHAQRHAGQRLLPLAGRDHRRDRVPGARVRRPRQQAPAERPTRPPSSRPDQRHLRPGRARDLRRAAGPPGVPAAAPQPAQAWSDPLLVHPRAHRRGPRGAGHPRPGRRADRRLRRTRRRSSASAA